MNTFSNILDAPVEADPYGGARSKERVQLRPFLREPMMIPVTIRSGDLLLPGELRLPPGFTSVVILAHGSRSSSRSPLNLYVAEVLQEEGIGTLIVDFWPAGSFRSERFDQNAYRKRLVDAFKWLHTLPETRSAKIGCFGSEEGGTAAVAAAAELGTNIRAVVSRGAKLDLPPDVLARVKAPTLLLAGGHDCLFVCHNNDAFVCLKCKKQMRLVAGATHLFEEPGTREKMAAFASNWFVEHLAMQ